MSVFVQLIEDPDWGNYYQLTGAGYAALIVIMLLILLGTMFVSGSINSEKKVSTKQLVFSAMAIALAVVTSFLKLVHFPMGGSITLFSMFFITIIGYWYGLRVGLTAAIAYGFLQLIIDPYIISVPQMLCDYILAFGALGISGLFSKSRYGMLKGYLAGVLGRYFFAFLSGMIFFGSYAADWGMSAPVYSLAYNGIYLASEAALTVIVLFIPPVTKGLERITRMAREV
ncbi:MAG: energy-coupled thiamine transporter ThiT [Lachnospiraceae bacterium]|nr:energy-coupled thiamine transporter ThiT [Lachnospiraceae bacterium]